MSTRQLTQRGSPARVQSDIMRRTELERRSNVRPFQDTTHPGARVIHLVNRLLSPPYMRDAFEAYIVVIDRGNGPRRRLLWRERRRFWVALREKSSSACSASNPQRATRWNCVVCMSTRPPDAADRPVDAQFCAADARRLKVRRLELSTSELQPAALEMYRPRDIGCLHEAVRAGEQQTLGGGIRRYTRKIL